MDLIKIYWQSGNNMCASVWLLAMGERSIYLVISNFILSNSTFGIVYEGNMYRILLVQQVNETCQTIWLLSLCRRNGVTSISGHTKKKQKYFVRQIKNLNGQARDILRLKLQRIGTVLCLKLIIKPKHVFHLIVVLYFFFSSIF